MLIIHAGNVGVAGNSYTSYSRSSGMVSLRGRALPMPMGPRTTTMVRLNLILEIIVSNEHDKFMMIYMALAMPMVVSRVYMRRQDKKIL